MTSELHALILAAGKGTRMKSELPKVVHPILGRPMVSYVIDAVKTIGCDKTILVTGFKSDVVKASLKDLYKEPLYYAEQTEQLGTGHAVQCYAKDVKETDRPQDLLVVCGDTPLISIATLNQMVEMHRAQKPAITMMTLIITEPGKYGRILRDEKGNVTSIREAKDCTEDELRIKEINLGVYLFDSKFLFENVFKLEPNNKQKEYYITNLVEIAVSQGKKVIACIEKDESSTLGINSRQHLADVSAILLNQILAKHMENGVTITSPSQTLIGPKVVIEPDTTIEPGCMILGETQIGKNSVIGPCVKLNNAKIADGSSLEYCIIENTTVSKDIKVLPFTSVIG